MQTSLALMFLFPLDAITNSGKRIQQINSAEQQLKIPAELVRINEIWLKERNFSCGFAMDVSWRQRKGLRWCYSCNAIYEPTHKFKDLLFSSPEFYIFCEITLIYVILLFSQDFQKKKI